MTHLQRGSFYSYSCSIWHGKVVQPTREPEAHGFFDRGRANAGPQRQKNLNTTVVMLQTGRKLSAMQAVRPAQGAFMITPVLATCGSYNGTCCLVTHSAAVIVLLHCMCRLYHDCTTQSVALNYALQIACKSLSLP